MSKSGPSGRGNPLREDENPRHNDEASNGNISHTPSEKAQNDEESLSQSHLAASRYTSDYSDAPTARLEELLEKGIQELSMARERSDHDTQSLSGPDAPSSVTPGPSSPLPSFTAHSSSLPDYLLDSAAAARGRRGSAPAHDSQTEEEDTQGRDLEEGVGIDETYSGEDGGVDEDIGFDENYSNPEGSSGSADKSPIKQMLSLVEFVQKLRQLVGQVYAGTCPETPNPYDREMDSEYLKECEDYLEEYMRFPHVVGDNPADGSGEGNSLLD